MNQQAQLSHRGQRIVIVHGLRTSSVRHAPAFHSIPAFELGRMTVNEMMVHSELPSELIKLPVFGQVVQMPAAPNIAREIVLASGLSVYTDAYSVNRVCATSFQAVVNVAESILAGIISIDIAGGLALVTSCAAAIVLESH